MRRIVRSATPPVLLTMIAVASLASCGSGASSVFHASDPGFRPTPGTMPPVYLPSDRAGIPRVQMRSVGIIEVTVPERAGIKAAAEAAAEKGRELGCWIVVEHDVFTEVQTRTSLAHGARVLLAHGGGGHVSPGAPRRAARRLTVRFDCVLQATGDHAARSRGVPCNQSIMKSCLDA